MKVRLDQLVGVKEVQRTLPKLAERLEKGEGPFVITKRSKPIALLTELPKDDRGE